jgi:hypothetical protein
MSSGLTASAEALEPTVEDKMENQIVLDQLRAFADVMSDDWMIKLVAGVLVEQAKDIFAHAALPLAQDLYFDGHPILFRDIEFRLCQTITATKDAIEKFNLFLGDQDLGAMRKSLGSIDVDKIMKDATEDATVDILRKIDMDREPTLRATTEEELARCCEK